MKKLTVFTPTYNRGYCLDQCYESLAQQTRSDFIWLVIDDGSTDNTRELVEQWAAEARIEIRYYYQANQGMHGAHNTAYERIDTELNVCIDSDDSMPPDAVAKILACWEQYGSDEVSGIVGLDADAGGQVIGTRLPEGVNRSTLFGLHHRHGVSGDKKLVYRSELTRRYPYPLFHGERYVGLAYKYYRLDVDYELVLLNEVLCTVEYLPDGSSRNMLKQYRRNPQGFAFYRTELMKLPFAGTLFKFRHAIHYVAASLIARNRAFLAETPLRGLTLLALPPGLLLYLYIRTKTGRRPAVKGIANDYPLG